MTPGCVWKTAPFFWLNDRIRAQSELSVDVVWPSSTYRQTITAHHRNATQVSSVHADRPPQRAKARAPRVTIAPTTSMLLCVLLDSTVLESVISVQEIATQGRTILFRSSRIVRYVQRVLCALKRRCWRLNCAQLGLSAFLLGLLHQYCFALQVISVERVHEHWIRQMLTPSGLCLAQRVLTVLVVWHITQQLIGFLVDRRVL